VLNQPHNYPRLVHLPHIDTESKEGKYNGYVRPIVNELIPGTQPIVMAYLTYCAPGSIKGPHMHYAPKEDRFVCVEGECVVVCRSERGGDEMYEFILDADDQMVIIPPDTSHAIVSKDGALVLSLPNEGYYPGHYNQIESQYHNYDWSKWLK